MPSPGRRPVRLRHAAGVSIHAARSRASRTRKFATLDHQVDIAEQFLESRYVRIFVALRSLIQSPAMR
jgi:hypothetical protein